MATRNTKLSRPVPARFDPDDLDDLEAEARATSLDLASLIRRDIKLYRALCAHRRGFRFSQVSSTELQEHELKSFEPYLLPEAELAAS